MASQGPSGFFHQSFCNMECCSNRHTNTSELLKIAIYFCYFAEFYYLDHHQMSFLFGDSLFDNKIAFKPYH